MLRDGGENWGRGFALDAQQCLSPMYARPAVDTPGGELSAASAYRRITRPVALWYGRLDSTVPLGTARWLARLLPRAALHVVDTAGHGLYVDHAPAVLDDLLARVESNQY